MASEIAKVRRRRTSKRNVTLNTTLVEVNSLLDDGTLDGEEAEIELSSRLDILGQAINQITTWDEEIANLLDDDAEVEKDEKEALEFKLKVNTAIKKIEKYLRKKQENDMKQFGTGRMGFMMNSSQANGAESQSRGVKLPKISIQKFDGDIASWNSFIETFEAAVDSKDNLTSVEKFTYLKGYLSGSALQCIEGFPLSHDNYSEALKLLKERFGNIQVIISTHMNKLINLERVTSCNVIQLRQLYDKIETNVRALNSVGIDAEHFGPLLIPIVVEKIPNVVRLQITRKLGKENWDVNEFLKCINDEVSAREHFKYLYKQDDDEKADYTASALAIASGSASGKRQCVFCEKSHFSDQCNIVTDIEARREILRRKRYCFRCLRGSHMARSCRVHVKCYRYHVVFCRVNRKEDKKEDKKGDGKDDGKDDGKGRKKDSDSENMIQTTCLVSEKKSVLLQTAVCNVIRNNNRVVCEGFI